MPFTSELIDEITRYTNGHLPSSQWYQENYYPFITDSLLRTRLITEYVNGRIIYKIFEGLQAKGDLLLAQIKTQVIMFVSIQEAAVNYVLFDLFEAKEPVQNLLYQIRMVPLSIPNNKMALLSKELIHDGKKLEIYYSEKRRVDQTKIRYDQKVSALFELSLISEQLRDDLIRLYEYRNTIHIEAELKKKLQYDLSMGELAFRRVEGLSIELTKSLNQFAK